MGNQAKECYNPAGSKFFLSLIEKFIQMNLKLAWGTCEPLIARSRQGMLYMQHLFTNTLYLGALRLSGERVHFQGKQLCPSLEIKPYWKEFAPLQVNSFL